GEVEREEDVARLREDRLLDPAPLRAGEGGDGEREAEGEPPAGARARGRRRGGGGAWDLKFETGNLQGARASLGAEDFRVRVARGREAARQLPGQPEGGQEEEPEKLRRGEGHQAEFWNLEAGFWISSLGRGR